MRHVNDLSFLMIACILLFLCAVVAAAEQPNENLFFDEGSFDQAFFSEDEDYFEGLFPQEFEDADPDVSDDEDSQTLFDDSDATAEEDEERGRARA